jgi:cob(I)alamin adenosyltransferase
VRSAGSSSWLGARTWTPVIVVYLNRLSDLLFVLARLENQHSGVEDQEWHPE